MLEPPKGIATLAVHAGHEAEACTGAITPSITLATTFKQRSPGVPFADFEYSRSGNPTRKTLEDGIAKMEGAEYGLCFSSGLAAITALGHIIQPGSHLLSVSDVYGGTRRYFSKVICNFGIETTYAHMEDPAELKAHIKSTTKMVWVETPTNPTLTVVDIAAVQRVVKSIDPDIIFVVDNTFLSPVLQRPLQLGADVVLHSASKYINGHCDVVMGMIATNNRNLYERVQFFQNALGGVPSPFDCYMVLRGMRTLHIRMERHCKNAAAIAAFLTTHPRIEHVYYPGLPTHPNHEVAKRQQSGFGGMVSFRLKGDLAHTCKLAALTKVFTLAESLGGVESLIEMPSIMTHGGMTPQERRDLGITDSFVRLSVGIEDVDDLIADLAQAIDGAFDS